MIRVNGRLQIRQSSGNRLEKTPCGILQARLKSASAEPTRVLEKAHLPVSRTTAFAENSWQICSVTLNIRSRRYEVKFEMRPRRSSPQCFIRPDGVLALIRIICLAVFFPVAHQRGLRRSRVVH